MDCGHNTLHTVPCSLCSYSLAQLLAAKVSQVSFFPSPVHSWADCVLDSISHTCSITNLGAIHVKVLSILFAMKRPVQIHGTVPLEPVCAAT